MQDHLWVVWYQDIHGKWDIWAIEPSRRVAREHAAALSFPTRIRKFIAA